MERERLREIALEFKQSGAFSSIAQQSQSFQQPMQEQTFSAFSSYSMSKPKEMSQAYLEAVAASQRIAASKSFTEMFRCSNSNDSNSNNAFNYEDTNSSKFEIGHKFYLVYDVYLFNRRVTGDGDSCARQRKKRSRWGGGESDKTFIPGMPTVLPSHLDSQQTDAYLGSYNTHVFRSFNQFILQYVKFYKYLIMSFILNLYKY